MNKPETNPIETTLSQREHTHGSFQDNAEIYAYLKKVTENCLTRFKDLTNEEKLALDMVFGKIARILSPKEKTNPDDWHDIEGYLRLAQKIAWKTNPPTLK